MFGFDRICKPLSDLLTDHLHSTISHKSFKMETLFLSYLGFVAYRKYKSRRNNLSVSESNEPAVFLFGCRSPTLTVDDKPARAFVYGFTKRNGCVKRLIERGEVIWSVAGGIDPSHQQGLSNFVKTYNSYLNANMGWLPMTKEELSQYFKTDENTVFSPPEYDDILYSPQKYFEEPSVKLIMIDLDIPKLLACYVGIRAIYYFGKLFYLKQIAKN